jgi:hypothetical protein
MAWLMLQVQKGVMGKRGPHHDISSLTAVAAVRTSTRNIFFPPETDTTAAAVSGLYINVCFVNEFHLCTK